MQFHPRPSQLALILALGAGCAAEQQSAEAPTAFVKGEVLVAYHKDLAQTGEDDLLARFALSRLRRHQNLRLDLLSIDDNSDVASKIERLRHDPDVLFAEPNFIHTAQKLPAEWNQQHWSLHNEGAYGPTDVDIDAAEAWEISTGSKDVVVAVIDTGVSWSHPDLQGNTWVNPGEVSGNGVDDDGNGYADDVVGWDFYGDDNYPSDSDGHGTHVAGIIGAQGDNGQGTAGVAWDVSLMAIRYLGPQGGTTSDAVSAIEYAVDNGADVINASWGSTGYSSSIRSAISYANDHDVLFVTAAGNMGVDLDRYSFYPAEYDLPNIVSVASINYQDKLASSSCYGASSVDLAAPGEPIYSTYPGDDYAWLSGTSMAAPAVSGAAALALSVDPGLGAAELRQLLMDSADVTGTLSGKTVSGGRLNAYSLLQAVEPDSAEQPDEEEPDSGDGSQTWRTVSYAISTEHPYADEFSGYAVIEAAGASELRLHFDDLNTEQGYDYVYLANYEGEIYASYTGDFGSFVSDPIPADQVVIWLVTDSSVTGHGFDVSGYSWR